MKEILQTDRLLLRTWTPGDALSLFEICSDPEVMLHVGAGKPYQDVDEARRFLDWVVAYQEENGFCRWAVIDKASQELIGSCGFARLECSGEIDLGYLFARQAWGKGYAPEAGRACLKYGFKQLKLARVIALTDPEHTASQRVLEKIGFTRLGIKRYDGEDKMVYVAVDAEERRLC